MATFNEPLMLGLVQSKPKDFLTIALSSPIEQGDKVEIAYQVEGCEVVLEFTVQEPLLLSEGISWQYSGVVSTHTLDAEQHATVTKIFCTHELFVLIKRYQFLLNSSKRDESLHEFFTADRLDQQSKIDFYPLMNLLTAYFESH